MKQKLALAMALAMTATMAQPILADSSTPLSSVSTVHRPRPGGHSLKRILRPKILTLTLISKSYHGMISIQK